MARPLTSSPAGTPVSRSSRSIRRWGEASSCPPSRTARSKSRPSSRTRTSSCHGGAPSARVALADGVIGAQRLAVVGRARPPARAGSAFSSMPAKPFGEKRPARGRCARTSRSRRSPAAARRRGPVGRSSQHSRSRRWPSASRRSRIAPARTSAGADTTRPVGWTKPSHSRWARTWGRAWPCSVRVGPQVDEPDRLDRAWRGPRRSRRCAAARSRARGRTASSRCSQERMFASSWRRSSSSKPSVSCGSPPVVADQLVADTLALTRRACRAGRGARARRARAACGRRRRRAPRHAAQAGAAARRRRARRPRVAGARSRVGWPSRRGLRQARRRAVPGLRDSASRA